MLYFYFYVYVQELSFVPWKNLHAVEIFFTHSLRNILLPVTGFEPTFWKFRVLPVECLISKATTLPCQWEFISIFILDKTIPATLYYFSSIKNGSIFFLLSSSTHQAINQSNNYENGLKKKSFFGLYGLIETF